MWSSANKDLAAKFGRGKSLPGEVEYGTYVARELMALGYAPKQVYVPGQPSFLMAMPLMGGALEALLVCRVLPGSVDTNTMRPLASMRSMRRSAVFAIVTTGRLDQQARQYVAANKIPCVDQFAVGDDVGRILGATGVVPDALMSMLGRASMKVSELERKLRETEEALRFQEHQLEVVSRGPVSVQKDPGKMDGKDKLQAGLMDPMLPKAMEAICGTNATSAGTLVKRLRCTPEKAELLLDQMEELGIVTHAGKGAPRFVKMTKTMMEKNFGLSGLRQDEYLG